NLANCTLYYVGAGLCKQDSITVLPNPLNDAEMTVFGAKPRWEYGVNVSGGSTNFRYYAGVDFEKATGPLQLPREYVKQEQERLGKSKIPRSKLEPNTQDRISIRSNVDIDLASTARLQLNAGYTQ